MFVGCLACVRTHLILTTTLKDSIITIICFTVEAAEAQKGK